MSWITIAKPASESWIRHNPAGKEQYDESDITYDDVNVFYDSANHNMWTNVSKPNTLLTWDEATYPWDDAESIWGSPTWVMIPKP